jgi:hypothetical protein
MFAARQVAEEEELTSNILQYKSIGPIVGALTCSDVPLRDNAVRSKL